MPEQQHSPSAAAWTGRVLAGHRIDALVGEGGMGLVYRATHLRLQRTVALKVLPPSMAADRDYRRRFEREAAIAASLEHPNVVPIYDAGHADGVLYLAMRFVDGEDLGAVLRREGRLGVEGVCAVLGPVADALDAVHAAGLVHRDVKPGNVLIARTRGPRGAQVYLCDFGIAKGAASGGRDLTSAGQFLGTVQYASPEQIEGGWLDGRSDQYGLACLAFRCLTGQVPYPRTETAAVIYAQLSADPPRPSLHRRDLPPAVDTVIARAAAKHPDHRFPSCAAFVAALRAAGADPVPEPRAGSDAAVPVRAGRAARQATLPLPAPREENQPTRRAGRGELLDPTAPTVESVPPPVDVRAERGADDRSIAISWTAAGPPEVEYKITRLAPDGRWSVVGRTRSTGIVDGAVAPDAQVPVYGVVARLGAALSQLVRSPAAPQPPAAVPAAGPDPVPDADPPGGIPAVTHLARSAGGLLVFEWPPGITEAMVVVSWGRPPESPGDPAGTAWKITNMRYQLDGGLRLPASVALPCHVAVASCRRVDGVLVVAPGFDPTAHAVARQ